VAPRAVRRAVDRRAVVRKAVVHRADRAAVRLAAVKDLAAHPLASQCRAAAGFQVFRVLAPVPPVAVVVVSQAAALPRAAVELRAAHRMKAFSEDRVAVAVAVPLALLVVKQAAKAVKRVVVLLDRRAAVLKGAWLAERPVVLPAKWVAQAVRVAVCPAVPVNPAVVAAMPEVPEDRLARATAAAPAGALVAARAQVAARVAQAR